MSQHFGLVLNYSFNSDEPIDSDSRLLSEDEKRKRMIELTTFASSLKNALESTGLKNLEGYLEASSGFLPGGKAGFKATLTLSNTE